MKKTFLITLLAAISYFGFTQTGNLDFVQRKSTDSGSTVYFEVLNISDESQAQEIISDLKKLTGVSNVRYFKSGTGGDRFQLYISNDVTAYQIRDILIANNTDYDYRTIIQNGVTPESFGQSVSTENRSEKSYSNPDMPQYTSTGNKTQDDENYRIAKEQWIKENPEQYESMLKEIEIKTE
jgi:uncharacterized protein involved in type VI secretion and phage assembly